jgi:hypothetical protein
VNVGAQPYTNIAAHLGSPLAGSGYTVSTGTQAGRLSRGTTASACGSQLANPGILASAGFDPRLYDAYKFTNTSPVSQCVTTIMSADSGLNMYTAAYNDSGFVPDSPSTHFLAEPGQSTTAQTYSFDVPSGKSFTVVVHEVNSGTLAGTLYTLSVSLSNCSVSPLKNSINLIANAVDNKVPLQWNVINETNARNYEVERSTDGNNFIALSSVTSAVVNANNGYTHTDALPVTGNNYYRIKQVNADGSVAYSNIAMVKIADVNGVTITPNPASGYVNIYAKSAIKQIQLLSNDGRLLQAAKPNAGFYRKQ